MRKEKTPILCFYLRKYIRTIRAKIRKCISVNRWDYWIFTQITHFTHFLEDRYLF